IAYYGSKTYISETYENYYTSMHGCDSIQRLRLIVHQRKYTHLDVSICDNEDYNFGGKKYLLPLPGIYYDTIILSSAMNCDSVITLTLNVYPTYLFETSKLIGSNEIYEWRGMIIHGADYQGMTEPVIFWDSIEGGTVGHHCDSVYKLTLQVAPTYHFYDQARICSNEEFRWSHLPDIDTIFQGINLSIKGVLVGVNIYRDTLRTIMDCDSIFELQLIVDSAYLMVGELDTTRIDICANETYHFKSLSKDTTINNNGDLANADKSINIFIIEGMDTTIHGCDSAICHKVYIHPTYDFTQKEYICQDTIDTEWEWIDDQGGSHGSYPRDKAGVYQLGDHKYTQQGCDSVFGLELHVMPSYRFDTILYICESDSISWQNVLFVGNQFSAYGKDFDAAPYDSVRTNMAAGEYTSIVRHYTNIYECDSTYIAKIIVSKVYRTTIERRTCQTTDGYYYEHLNRGSGGFLPAQYLSDSLTRNDTIQSILGCDSIITLKFFVDSVYDYRQVFEVCQDTINTQWEWIDDDNVSHGFISIADSGNYSYEQKYKTIHGCDSIYGMKIRVKPTYRFDSIYSICEDERISWQHRWYTGDSALTFEGDRVLTPGVYFDTARYTTQELCDSIYYLVLNVYPIYDTLTQILACENEGYTWYQSDKYGAYEDVIYPASSYHKFYITSDEASNNHPKSLIDTIVIHCNRLLKTIHDCDSMSHLELVVNPAYMFITDTTICGNVAIKYRGKFFRGQDTIYMDSLQTKDGCDSIYQLRLHVRPIFISHEYRALCDDQTIYHESSNGKEIIWKPGNDIPDPDFEYIDAIYTDNNGCDSIYRYHLNIHPTFFHSDTDTICSNTHYLFHNSTDISLMREYEVSNWIQPFDTIFKDSLQTSYGCDSVYWLYAHIIPAYRDVLVDTICDNQVYSWRNRRIEFNSNNREETYIFRDSLTSIDGCDSIYELHLHVTPTFYEEYTETICADEYYLFRGEQINATGIYYDSLKTIYGCDSVYQLLLTVLDTTYEIRHDTICVDESYNLHGVWLDKPGFYKDTILNDWGCHHFTYLYLTIINPTIPHAWADSLCKSHESFDVMFTYTGIKPIMYSLYFDDFGHSQGFEDIIHEPIDDDLWDNGAYPMTIQMPWRDGDSTKYPRPDHYPIEVFLFNGYCIDSLRSRHDTDIVMSYPSWITEQRFQDVIAILSTKYNGGYTFETYQWYKNGEPLVGETHEYLYLPQELDTIAAEYWVRLTRSGETESFQTCPITIHEYNVDTVAPFYDYLSVVPTYVVKEHPVVNVLTHGNKGVYKIYNPTGLMIQEGEFYPGEHNAFEITLPSLQGMYLFYLHSDEAIYEKDRTIRVLVE
ncbi:MAG: hypothetical protein KBT27_11255, partial [Prevotellaceae bacterium]|nr:hypothetical protein [Candidatus Faecinaster equi]